MPDLPGVPEVTRAEHIGPAHTGDNIDAKRVAGYVWNQFTNGWERSTTSGGTTQITSRYDYSAPPVYYIGQAAAGSSESSAVWLVNKYDLTSSADALGEVASNIAWSG